MCRLAPRRELESDAEAQALVERLLAPEWRLLQGQYAPGATGALRIAHDVLLDQAEAFRTFVENERNNVLLLADAQDATARWKAEGEPAALLNHHLPSVERLQALLARLEMPADQHTRPGRVEHRAQDVALMAAQHPTLANGPRGTIQFDHGFGGDHTPDRSVRNGNGLEADSQRGAEVRNVVAL